MLTAFEFWNGAQPATPKGFPFVEALRMIMLAVTLCTADKHALSDSVLMTCDVVFGMLPAFCVSIRDACARSSLMRHGHHHATEVVLLCHAA